MYVGNIGISVELNDHFWTKENRSNIKDENILKSFKSKSGIELPHVQKNKTE